MQITFLGHAGFCVETSDVILIMDPWFSPTGAYDSAWFQFPRNHHLGAFVQEKMQDPAKEKYIYISHAHKDHFDLAYLESLRSRDFKLILPDFRRRELVEALQDYKYEKIILCKDEDKVKISGGYLKLFLDDSEMNRDSAILVNINGNSFFNMNDSKTHDRLARILKTDGNIDVFTAQYSGAGWHPTCYKYSQKQYEQISRRKMLGKFEAVYRAIDTVNPSIFLPSAGPPCFLDPILYHLNFQKVNIFPYGPKFVQYINNRLKKPDIHTYYAMPGDVLDVQSKSFVYLAEERVDDRNCQSYLKQYAALYRLYFRERQQLDLPGGVDAIFSKLLAELRRKLDWLSLRERVKIPLYFGLHDISDRYIRVDFQNNIVAEAKCIAEANYYAISTYSWEIARVLDRKITWEDFTLTFRMTISREPDIYETVIHGFLMMEIEDMNWFCRKVLDAESLNERMLIRTQECNYSVNRYCPHQGADLSQGWIEKDRYLVCPRHRWSFDLKNEGQCTMNNGATIKAYLIDET